MFTQSFHTHTWRCNHASDTERDYVEQAVRSGMTILGFSDHSPYVFEGDYYSGFRMKPEQIRDYFDVTCALRDEFKHKIEIHTGFEAEYYPKFFSRFEKLISQYPTEYLIMGQHFLFNEMEGVSSQRETNDDELLKAYVNQVIEGMSTGMFAYVAHPDVIHYVGNADTYRREMSRLCEGALKYNVPLEINMLGIRTNRFYPNQEFWKLVGEVGNDVVCGSDAHSAIDVCDEASYSKALLMANEYGLKLKDTSIIKSGGHWLK